MVVAVMGVGIMRVRMHERFVAMPMVVRFAGRIGGRVRVVVMFVVVMHVFVLQLLVRVEVLMPFHQVQPHTRRHQ